MRNKFKTDNKILENKKLALFITNLSSLKFWKKVGHVSLSLSQISYPFLIGSGVWLLVQKPLYGMKSDSPPIVRRFSEGVISSTVSQLENNINKKYSQSAGNSPLPIPSNRSRESTHPLPIPKKSFNQDPFSNKKSLNSSPQTSQSGRLSLKNSHPPSLSSCNEGEEDAHRFSFFYKDRGHPLTSEFWQQQVISYRLQKWWASLQPEGSPTNHKKKFPLKSACNEKYLKLLQADEIINEDDYIKDLLEVRPSKYKKIKIQSRDGELTIIKSDTIKIAIKKFKVLKKGAKELLYSLAALKSNPSPDIKMAGVYDAYIGPDKRLSIVMEGMIEEPLSYYLSTSFAISAVKAAGEYLANFHISHYQRLRHDSDKINRSPLSQYITHVASLSNTLPFFSLKEDEKANNIIKSLTEEEQKDFIWCVKNRQARFKENVDKIRTSGSPIVFPTVAHADAHVDNLFFTPKSLKKEKKVISKDSFYRISTIDFAKMKRTLRDISADPGEDVGRLVASFWEWAARQHKSSLEEIGKQIVPLEEGLVDSYLETISKHEILPSKNRGIFEKIFKESYGFHELRFYGIICRSEQPDETKLKILRSCINECKKKLAAEVADFPLQEIDQPNRANESSSLSSLPLQLMSTPAHGLKGKALNSFFDAVDTFYYYFKNNKENNNMEILLENFSHIERLILHSKEYNLFSREVGCLQWYQELMILYGKIVNETDRSSSSLYQLPHNNMGLQDKANSVEHDYVLLTPIKNLNEAQEIKEELKNIFEKSHSKIRCALGLFYYKDNSPQALSWLLSAANDIEHPNRDASYYLGQIYTYGIAPVKEKNPNRVNTPQALSWLKISTNNVERHDSETSFNLGQSSTYGTTPDGEENIEKIIPNQGAAKFWHRKAAQLGHPHADFLINEEY